MPKRMSEFLWTRKVFLVEIGWGSEATPNLLKSLCYIYEFRLILADNWRINLFATLLLADNWRIIRHGQVSKLKAA